MIPQSCKRLAEVDFPIAEVSRHAAREKSIRHGHPSTLHLWWARRPLASSRAMLLALLLPDPCDLLCPMDFKARARELLLAMTARPSAWDSAVADDAGLRQVLLKFIADFANWDNAAKSEYLETGRGLVRAAHPDDTPLVVDPFAGGGSIPLEALRLGCDAFASDLNPVACLILKVMLEDIPRHGPGLAAELRKAGAEIKAQADRELAALYPKDPDGSTPIAYLWARTVRCEAPNCGAEIPLMRSMWLCRKPNRKWALRPDVVRDDGVPPRVEFEIFQPQTEREVANGTVSRARATCPCCRAVLPPERVRSQLAAQRGGADAVFDGHGNRISGARMTAVVTLKPGQPGRHYRLPTAADYAAVRLAQQRVADILGEWERGGQQGLCPVPDEPTPVKGTHRSVGSQLPLYNMTTFGDLFAARQKATLARLLELIQSHSGESLAPILACAFNRVAMSNMSCTRWNAVAEKMQHTFGRQAYPIVWDFAEVAITSDAPGNWKSGYSLIVDVVTALRVAGHGEVQIADSTEHPLPSESAQVWFTDPPYYDAIPYADLSDFFFVWLKRSLGDHPLLRDPFDAENTLSPKSREALQSEIRWYEGKLKNSQWFEETMAQAFAEGRRVLDGSGVGAVIFAHKTTEGWEALLSGMIQGGWTITGSWPISTEMGSRLNARDTAALATSVHLVCRPRPEDARVGEWGVVLRELPERVGEWMERLQSEGVRGADLVFACVGPALEIFSRYSRVETVAGDAVALPEYLERVWEVVGREALAQVLSTAEAQARNGAAGALEEDARLTALFLWTLQSSGSDGAGANGDPTDSDGDDEDGAVANGGRREPGYRMLYDVTRRFAQPLGIHLDDWKSRIIEIDKGVVRLMPVSERSEQLFGSVGASALADEIEYNATASPQLSLFPDAPPPSGSGTRRGRNTAKGGQPSELSTRRDATTLDRVHAAMLFQDSGRSQALRALIQSEQERGPDFLRLANALSALYAGGSHEKRLLDAMLLAVPR